MIPGWKHDRMSGGFTLFNSKSLWSQLPILRINSKIMNMPLSAEIYQA